MNNFAKIKSAIFGAALLGITSFASAIPTLQLGITGGTYDATTQTIIASSSSFSLYAYLIPDSSNPISDVYSLSMAVTPSVSSPASLGSFTVDGNAVDVTSGMNYGVPPLDADLADGDLATHGIFPTYFKEISFSFSAANQSAAFNTADEPASGPQAGTGMYFQKFDIDVTNLSVDHAIHFDLYNTAICDNGKCTPGNLDVSQFAPFSHDAQSGPGDGGGPPNETPEPTTLLLFALGALGLGIARRKA
jgi:PEP-CTERM motif